MATAMAGGLGRSIDRVTLSIISPTATGKCYRGADYFYSGGYWYRPHGGSYIVVTPPYGVRVNYLPPYAQEVWLGGAMFFLVADTYYQYLADSRNTWWSTRPSAPLRLYRWHRQTAGMTWWLTR